MRLKALKTLAFPDVACAAGRYFSAPEKRALELIKQGLAEDATPKKKAKPEELKAPEGEEEAQEEGTTEGEEEPAKPRNQRLKKRK